MINLKIYLSDLTKWRVHITGSHVPPDGPVQWQRPPKKRQRIDEDTRDFIVYHSSKVNPTQIADMLKKDSPSKEVDNFVKKRVMYFVSSMKKRRRTRDYNYAETAKKYHDDGENENCPDSENNHVNVKVTDNNSKSDQSTTDVPLEIVSVQPVEGKSSDTGTSQWVYGDTVGVDNTPAPLIMMYKAQAADGHVAYKWQQCPKS